MRALLRWLWFLAFAAAGVFAVYLAAYHYWAAGFPPSEAAQWHESWGNIFGAAALASWATAGLGVWFFRPPQRTRRAMP